VQAGNFSAPRAKTVDCGYVEGNFSGDAIYAALFPALAAVWGSFCHGNWNNVVSVLERAASR